MKSLCRIPIEQLSRSWTVKLTVAAVLFLLIGTLLIFTVQFDRIPKEVKLSINAGNELVYPLHECEADWFPARHWARQSSKFSNSSVATVHHGQQMHGTLAAQHAIWNHQHPSTCHDKKFLVYEALGRDHGIGSVVHVLSIALQAALNMNRILLLSPQPNFEWVQGKFCEGTDTLDECYFEPVSSCTILDAMGSLEGGVDVLKFAPELNVETYRNNSERVLRSAISQMGSNLLPFLMRDTPLMFHGLLQRGGVSTNFL